MTPPLKVLVTGSRGQLGFELRQCRPAHVTLIETDHDTLDICDPEQIRAALEQHQPHWLINGAAYTALDRAESERLTAERVNAQAPGLLAQAIAHARGEGLPTRLLQVSTDFVFDGEHSSPWTPEQPTGTPTGVYGITKLAGEQAVQRVLTDALIVRTSWLYSTHGSNFVKSMLRLMREKPHLGVVFDQTGSPTWARTLALTLWDLIGQQPDGIFHCSDNGVASWYDFAVAIQEEALQLGLLERAIPVYPIRTRDYPTPARRPAYSVMDKSRTEQVLGRILPYWRVSLRAMLQQLKTETAHA
ncbi:MAG TPA: dTDP-4-dehydrorhamnose reductase [Thiolinea sp.]|nr:dTDP-4-dehydrorhamnose reductase [Thiolinea sp.]